jgi:hypothetical protein
MAAVVDAEMLMADTLMHDWTLRNIDVAWKSGTVRLDLICSPGVIKSLTAQDLIELVVPRRQEWGPSESIMSHEGPRSRSDGNQQLEILMQSGDSLVIVAGEILMPSVD